MTETSLCGAYLHQKYPFKCCVLSVLKVIRAKNKNGGEPLILKLQELLLIAAVFLRS